MLVSSIQQSDSVIHINIYVYILLYNFFPISIIIEYWVEFSVLCSSLDISFYDLRSKGPSSQGYGFSSVHIWMWELDCCRCQPANLIRSREHAWCGWERKLQQKNTTTKMGSRGSDTSPRRDAVWPRLYSASFIYTGEREKDKTVNIFWLTYTSYKKSQEILRAWEWHPVIISYTR